MKEIILLVLFIWYIWGSIRFLSNLEQEDIELEVTGSDRILVLPFFLVARIVRKFNDQNNQTR